MRSNSPLNPTLYAGLLRAFGGKNRVRIHAPGLAIKWIVTGEPLKSGVDRGERRKVLNAGEEYIVNCPFCNDTRHRLTINHRWGVPDDECGGSPNLWLMHCYNEECQNNRDHQESLYERVYAFPAQLPRKVQVLAGIKELPAGAPVSPPGPMIRLDKLVEKHPHHHALEYLRGRFIDPEVLGKVFQAHYCPESVYTLARDRIIFPVYMDEQLVTWQARYIGDSVDGLSFKEAGVPKSFTCPGVSRSNAAYNFDQAVTYSTIAIVEGPLDVYGFGPMAMGLLGKTMNDYLIKHLKEAVRKWGDKLVILVVLDPDPDPVSFAKGLPHHITVVSKNLKAYFPGKVVPVYLPAGTDPGELDREFQWNICQAAAEKQGLTLHFAKPKKVPHESPRPATSKNRRRLQQPATP